jgi:hypothetical protein
MDASTKSTRKRTSREIENTRSQVKRNYDERGGKYRMALAYYIKLHPELTSHELLSSDEEEKLDKKEALRLKAVRAKEYHQKKKLDDF